MTVQSKISVTIVTGFLGAGKTTFINHILKNYPDVQFALVENEFGDVAIDTKLIKGIDASQMFELKEGCICCTITDEYELVLQELAERFPNVEHLLIETTGVAEPASVIRPFFNDENLKKLYTYSGTICLVDVLNFETQPEKETSVKQIVAADLVLINKTEQSSTEENRNLKTEIEQINPFCKINSTTVNDLALNIDLNTILQMEPAVAEFSGIHPEHLKLESKTITWESPLNKESFSEWLSYHLDVHKNEIYRIKGILCFENEPFEYILQGVGGSYELLEGENMVSENKSELVFIGRLEEIDFTIPF